MTKLAVSIMAQTLEQALASAVQAAEQGADLVEFRIDLLDNVIDALPRLVNQAPLPCIVTCRPHWEGGHYQGDEATRLDLFKSALKATHPPAYIDLELAAYQSSAAWRQWAHELGRNPALGTGLILSSHDFDTRPADLYQRLEAMANAEPCRAAKLAWRARSLRDNLEAFDIVRQRHKPTIALCMGEEGLPSRILARKAGAFLTFASLDARSGTAPGQVSVERLKNLYRWDKIGPATKVYGVIGHPVGHSMSPAIHNAGFEAVGFDGVYLLMPIAPEYEHFKATVSSWLAQHALDFRGASVTIPHKENLLRFMADWADRHGPDQAQVEPLAHSIGAANTLALRDDGSLFASNTDYAAALDAVCAGLGVARQGLAGHRVAVLGAGGVARAIVAGFLHYGADITLHNRTLDKAQALAGQLAPLGIQSHGLIQAASLDQIARRNYEVYINCTSVGMYPRIEETPMPTPPGAEHGWGPGTVVFDTIYNPSQTRWLREARAAGCVTISGTEMFVLQAAAQFELWTQCPAPIEVFRSQLQASLHPQV